MNILITGNLSYFAEALAEDLAKENNKIVLSSRKLPKNKSSKPRKITTHPVNPDEDIFTKVMAAYKFDHVIYLPTREEQTIIDNGSQSNEGHLLTGLKNTLELCKNENVERFIYFSSTEVYGNLQEVGETTQPVPESLNGYALYAGEQYCEYYQKKHELNITIIRVSFLYGPSEHSSYIYDLVSKCNTQKEISLPVEESKNCDFLHVDDVVNLVNRLINEPSSSSNPIINLSSSHPITNYDLSQRLADYFPEVKFTFDSKTPIFTRAVNVETAKTLYDWVDIHEFMVDLEDLIPKFNAEISLKKPDRKATIKSKTKGAIKWFELLLGVALMQFLTQFTGTLIQFKYVDFRLLFVVLMASVYGIRFGLLAAILSSLSILYTWYQLGFNWALISNNVGNWFPFVVYFTTGLLLGYHHDKQAMEIENEKKQTSLIYEKFKFLYGVFTEIRTLKDEFREKLVGYRDSFGKIYAITQELDTFEEGMIFTKALINLQEFLENDSIAIYAIGANRDFARLEVSSPDLAGRISKSLNIKQYPELIESIEKGAIFHNSTLLPGYPAYLSTIMSDNQPVAIVVIWEASFDQHTMYYYNLFKVITGLVQASLARAALFSTANLDNIFIPSTRILKPDAFHEALKVKMEMKKSKISDHQILRIDYKNQNFTELYVKVADKIRSEDMIGSYYDGNCYLVLSHASKDSINEIISRFGNFGGKCELIQDSEFKFVNQE